MTIPNFVLDTIKENKNHFKAIKETPYNIMVSDDNVINTIMLITKLGYEKLITKTDIFIYENISITETIRRKTKPHLKSSDIVTALRGASDAIKNINGNKNDRLVEILAIPNIDILRCYDSEKDDFIYRINLAENGHELVCSAIRSLPDTATGKDLIEAIKPIINKYDDQRCRQAIAISESGVCPDIDYSVKYNCYLFKPTGFPQEFSSRKDFIMYLFELGRMTKSLYSINPVSAMIIINEYILFNTNNNENHDSVRSVLLHICVEKNNTVECKINMLHYALSRIVGEEKCVVAGLFAFNVSYLRTGGTISLPATSNPLRTIEIIENILSYGDEDISILLPRYAKSVIHYDIEIISKCLSRLLGDYNKIKHGKDIDTRRHRRDIQSMGGEFVDI